MANRTLTGKQAFQWAEVFDLHDLLVDGKPTWWMDAPKRILSDYARMTIVADVVPMGWTPDYLARAAKAMPEIHPILVEMRALYDAEIAAFDKSSDYQPAAVEVRRFFRANRPANGSFTIDVARDSRLVR